MTVNKNDFEILTLFCSSSAGNLMDKFKSLMVMNILTRCDPIELSLLWELKKPLF